MHQGEIIANKDNQNIIDCENCGFPHVYPYPSQEKTQLLYSEEYYQKNRADYINNLKEDREWWENLYQERINMIQKYINTTKPVKVLDIGTGAGYFLNVAKKNQWMELGLEPSQMASFYAKEQGLNILQEFYNKEISGKIGKFEVIHMNHVLEHMIQPKEILNLIYDNLADGGIFCVAVPNDFNELQEIASKINHDNQWWVTPSEHINYFSFNNLKKLLNNCGFEILEETTSFPMEMFILMGDNYIAENSLGRGCHFKRKEFEKKLFEYNSHLKQKLYKALATQELGRDVILIVRKSGYND